MKVAGFGFRKGTTLAALQDALARAGGASGLSAIATADDKAGAAVIRSLGRALNMPVLAVAPATIVAQITLTRSARVKARYGTGSLAEAAALAAAGPGARLLAPRAQSQDGTATAAIAERTTP
jgi:cobalt-precorrin 5A hydrolase